MKDKTQQANQERRDFIKKSTLVGAGVVASSVAGIEAVAAASTDKAEPVAQKGYQLTQHVLDYYKSTAI